jgi:hypothetical protein
MKQEEQVIVSTAASSGEVTVSRMRDQPPSTFDSMHRLIHTLPTCLTRVDEWPVVVEHVAPVRLLSAVRRVRVNNHFIPRDYCWLAHPHVVYKHLQCSLACNQISGLRPVFCEGLPTLNVGFIQK